MGDYARLQELVDRLTTRGLRRQVRAIEPQGPTRGRLRDGRVVDVFCSNDYLGLAQHPEVRAAWKGGGTGSARLIAGDRVAHHALEDALSEWMGRPTTVLSTGWHANLAVLGAVLQRGDATTSDRLVHASLIDGLRLSRAQRTVLPHGSVDIPNDTRLHVTEGLFSMNGDRVNLAETERACRAAGAWLLVDEAHAIGCLGPHGRGAAAEAGVEPDFVVGTLGKALGAFGAFVTGPPVLRELLLSRGRAFIFTTGLPVPACRAAIAALKLATDDRRRALSRAGDRLRKGLVGLGLRPGGEGHIVPVVLGTRTMAVAQGLLDRGVYVAGIRPPTVPEGTERLRISVSAAHTDAQLDRLVHTLGDVLTAVPCNDARDPALES